MTLGSSARAQLPIAETTASATTAMNESVLLGNQALRQRFTRRCPEGTQGLMIDPTVATGLRPTTICHQGTRRVIRVTMVTQSTTRQAATNTLGFRKLATSSARLVASHEEVQAQQKTLSRAASSPLRFSRHLTLQVMLAITRTIPHSP